jgi:hypothetical protein
MMAATTRLRYKLHPKQLTALKSPATEILFGGAAGGGKSHLMRIAAISYCYQIPFLQVYLFRRTHGDLWKNHMDGKTGFPELLGPWIQAGYVQVNTSKHTIVFWNGAQIHLCHCQYEKDVVSRYQGAEIHVLMIDELTHFTESIYRYLRGRCRMGGLTIPDGISEKFPRILCGTNPGGLGHTWVKLHFVDPAAPYAVEPSDGGMMRQYIPSKLTDNPTMEENDPDYRERLKGLGNPALVRALLSGDWNIIAGGMFDDVWDEDRHVVDPFEIPVGWYVDRSFDWGSSAPYSVGWWAESDGSDITLRDGTTMPTRPGDLFRIDELYGWNGKANQGVKESTPQTVRSMRSKEQWMKDAGLNVRPGPADTSIWTEDGDGPSIYQRFRKLGIDWTRADKRPGSRVNGWELMRERFRNAMGREGPRLFVFSTCRQFIRTVPVLPRDSKNMEDVDKAAEDHVGDEARYRVVGSKIKSRLTIG